MFIIRAVPKLISFSIWSEAVCRHQSACRPKFVSVSVAIDLCVSSYECVSAATVLVSIPEIQQYQKTTVSFQQLSKWLCYCLSLFSARVLIYLFLIATSTTTTSVAVWVKEFPVNIFFFRLIFFLFSFPALFSRCFNCPLLPLSFSLIARSISSLSFTAHSSKPSVSQ